jgi:hypothetical protein
MAWLRGMGGWLGLQLGLSNVAVLGGARASTAYPPPAGGGGAGEAIGLLLVLTKAS